MAQSVFEKEYIISPDYCDAAAAMSPLAAFTIFQAMAAEHAEQIGVGGMAMAKPDTFLNATDVTLNGNVYNGTGYYGQKPKPLFVTLGKGAVLNGAVSATETRHIDENGNQNTHFTIKEFYHLAHVENRNFFNGDNTVEVTLKDGAVWNVTAPGIINKLTVGEGCILNGTVTENADGTLTVAPKA